MIAAGRAAGRGMQRDDDDTDDMEASEEAEAEMGVGAEPPLPEPEPLLPPGPPPSWLGWSPDQEQTMAGVGMGSATGCLGLFRLWNRPMTGVSIFFA